MLYEKIRGRHLNSRKNSLSFDHLDQLKLGNFSLKFSEFVSPNTPGPTTSNSLIAITHEKVGGLKLKATFQDAVKNGNRAVSKMDSIQYDLQDLCSLSLWLRFVDMRHLTLFPYLSACGCWNWFLNLKSFIKYQGIKQWTSNEHTAVFFRIFWVYVCTLYPSESFTHTPQQEKTYYLLDGFT